MGRAVTGIRDGRRDTTVGLFFTDVDWRTNEACDLNAWRWASEAACSGTDPEAWFPDYYSKKDTAYLRVICGGCPVRQTCLNTALRADLVGWWGGTSDADRRAIRAAGG